MNKAKLRICHTDKPPGLELRCGDLVVEGVRTLKLGPKNGDGTLYPGELLTATIEVSVEVDRPAKPEMPPNTKETDWGYST